VAEEKIVNERSTAYLSLTFLDKAQSPAEPLTVTFRIDDVASGAEVRGDTSITPAESVEITLTPADNVILNPNLAQEMRRVTVVGTYGVDDAVRSQFVYQVRNLSGVA